MKERPILFSAPMVQAILSGNKTQTRRVVKQQVVQDERFIGGFKLIGHGGVKTAIGGPLSSFQSPYGTPGDRLWVRETWAYGTHALNSRNAEQEGPWVYAADNAGTQGRLCDRWRPSIHMFRAASRITLEITGVRVERLCDISPSDAEVEGVRRLPLQERDLNPWWTADVSAGAALHSRSARGGYRNLWNAINGAGSWKANPWVWVVEFKRLEGGAA